jgi:hypothetical protein
MLKTYFVENNVVVLSIVAKEDMHAWTRGRFSRWRIDNQERQMDNN